MATDTEVDEWLTNMDQTRRVAHRLFGVRLSGPQAWALAVVGRIPVGRYMWTDIDPRTALALARRRLLATRADQPVVPYELSSLGRSVVDVVRGPGAT